ncbi:MAG: hypothetical protein J6R33_00595 [Clostridia bacterium]|nr:hypothetical protein [Clostridia bacterium]
MKKSKRIIGILLVFLMVCGLSVGVLAASVTTSIGGTTNVTVGQSFTVNVIFRGSGANIGALDANITYDTSKLTCTAINAPSGTQTSDAGGNIRVSYSNMDGASSIQVSMTFTAKAAGSASVRASISSCYDPMADPIGSYSGSSATVTVKTSAPPSQSSSKPQSSQASSKPSSRPQSSQPQSSAPVEDPQDTTVRVTVDGQEKIVVNSLIGIEIPEGFEVRQDEYRGQTVDILHHAQQDMLLMYLTDADGTNGGYYRFNRMADSFYPFVRISVNAARYTAAELARGAKVPSGWTKTTVPIAGQTVPAYESGDKAYQGFYLIFAANEQGQEGFYLYDSAEGTMQRYVQSSGYEPVTNPDGMTAADPNGNFFERLLADRAIFVTMCVAWALVVLIAGAWLVFHFARKQAHVSDKQRKKKEEKITKKLEKRAKKAAKKNKITQQKPEIGSLDEEIEAEMPENEVENAENDAEISENEAGNDAETSENEAEEVTETQTESEITE